MLLEMKTTLGCDATSVAPRQALGARVGEAAWAARRLGSLAMFAGVETATTMNGWPFVVGQRIDVDRRRRRGEALEVAGDLTPIRERPVGADREAQVLLR
jgi:hypothetical protein